MASHRSLQLARKRHRQAKSNPDPAVLFCRRTPQCLLEHGPVQPVQPQRSHLIEIQGSMGRRLVDGAVRVHQCVVAHPPQEPVDDARGSARAARELAPHLVTTYLKELAAEFHSYYNAERFLVDDPTTQRARLALAAATGLVVKNGLAVLGISAPDQM